MPPLPTTSKPETSTPTTAPDDDRVLVSSDRPTDDPPEPAGESETSAKSKLLELSFTQVIAGALAAVTSAALGSTLGVGGTLLGAAFGSVVAGVAAALYTASLRHTGDRLRTVLRPTRAEEPGDPMGSTSRTSRAATPRPRPTHRPSAPRTSTQRSGRLRWRAIGLTLAAFVVGVGALTGFELATGQALSGGKGTTIEQAGTPSAKPTPSPTPSASAPSSALPTPSPASTASSGPTAAPTAPADPSMDPGPPSPTLPSPTPTDSAAPTADTP